MTCIPSVYADYSGPQPCDYTCNYHCKPRCCDGVNECCEYEAAFSNGWQDCPDGYSPDWCERLELMKQLYPLVFGCDCDSPVKCINEKQLELWWRNAMCLVPVNNCHLRCNGDDTEGPGGLAIQMRDMLILHQATLFTEMAVAHSTSYVAGAMKGHVRPVIPATNKSGGGINMAEAAYSLTVYGVHYLTLREAMKRNVTGAYAAVNAQYRGSGRVQAGMGVLV